MNRSDDTPWAPAEGVPQLHETRAAFDSVAADYDGDRGNNAAIQDMRSEMWRWLDATFAPGSRLIDLGCGTGLDAARMARLGHRVTATDWSPEMVRRTGERAQSERLTERLQPLNLGAHELHRLGNQGTYDGAYSNLGPLNCVPDLAEVSRQCARLLKPAGLLVFTVIGRLCPWEAGYYLLQRRPSRAWVRFARGMVPVNLNKHTVWARYYRPREFYRPFRGHFRLTHYRGVCVFVPPPYLLWLRDAHREWYERLWRIDRRVAGWPLLRALGDHFLIVMRKR
ncbi:MAG TPA: methyltransferase domain-containing protein [Steroidobacteraceae bacterium]|nr:methyltransferase domain-containing protein [Steroidobacteraceae bacterium]